MAASPACPDCPTYGPGFRFAGTITGYLELGYLITDHIGLRPRAGMSGFRQRAPVTSPRLAGHESGFAAWARSLLPGPRRCNAQLQSRPIWEVATGYRFAFPPTNPGGKQLEPKLNPTVALPRIR